MKTFKYSNKETSQVIDFLSRTELFSRIIKKQCKSPEDISFFCSIALADKGINLDKVNCQRPSPKGEGFNTNPS